MREIVFVNRNKERWEQFEHLINDKSNNDPDIIASLYVQLTDDLSYARTFYPKSNTTLYLNQLSARIHQKIYKNQKMERGTFVRFWKKDLPLILFQTRKQMLHTFIIFAIAVIIGAISTRGDQSFVRTILGDNYVNMTINNIENNDPMAVYKQANETFMFLGITFNNIKVALIAFIFGIFFTVGTGWVLFNNGVMLGSFTAFFIQHGLFWETTRVIWIHGALEIPAIIIAGAAGIVLGNSFLFPKTLPRKTSLLIGAQRGLRILCSTIPLFIVAGFLEGFVTRHTEMPLLLSWAIILSSFAFIIWYFIIHPREVYRKLTNQ